MELNLNQIVKVKLTDYGERILKRRHYEVQNLIQEYNPEHAIRPFELKLDEEGNYKDQLWCIMRDFGPYTDIGTEQPLLATIIVED
ncbi:hypothetical protein ACQUEU_00665 [Enterococcus casseliflavus]|uniref:hypothetical protein n=1 Tax=Enterococcus casseliflavus TaxID=37734 RepID=UPI003D1174B4